MNKNKDKSQFKEHIFVIKKINLILKNKAASSMTLTYFLINK